MGENKTSDLATALKRADSALADLQLAIAGADRFNPGYFYALAACLLLLGAIPLVSAIDRLPQIHGIQMIEAGLSVFGVVSSVRTFLEGKRYGARWARATTTLSTSLNKAETLAGIGFVTIDKTRSDESEFDEIKEKYVALARTIRDARELLGLKD